MYRFSERSKLHLATCHPDIRNVFNNVIKFRDCAIIEGHRQEERQEEMFRTGMSQLHFPDSRHNGQPSLAVDVVPYFADRDPHIDWNDREAFILFAGVVLGVAGGKGIKMICGCDWNNNGILSDNRFQDMGHFELISNE